LTDSLERLLLIMACPVSETWVHTAEAAGVWEVCDLDTLLNKARPTTIFPTLQRFLHEIRVPGIELDEVQGDEEEISLHRLPHAQESHFIATS
jgi:hypothetical protein